MRDTNGYENIFDPICWHRTVVWNHCTFVTPDRPEKPRISTYSAELSRSILHFPWNSENRRFCQWFCNACLNFFSVYDNHSSWLLFTVCSCNSSQIWKNCFTRFFMRNWVGITQKHHRPIDHYVRKRLKKQEYHERESKVLRYFHENNVKYRRFWQKRTWSWWSAARAL